MLDDIESPPVGSRDTEQLEIPEASLPVSIRQRYQQLQVVAIGAAIVHASAVLLCVYAVKEGNLYDFSVTRLLQFVPAFTGLWQISCFAVALSSVSYMVTFVAMKHVLRVRQTMWLNVGIFLVLIAVANDLHSLGSMMIYFADIARQFVNGTFSKNQLLMEAWSVLSNSVTDSLIIANTLYSVAGLILARAIISGYGLPKWLGWTAIPIFVVGLLASILIFQGEFSMAIVMMFATIITFILWAVAMAVAIDPFAHEHKHAAEENQTTKTN